MASVQQVVIVRTTSSECNECLRWTRNQEQILIEANAAEGLKESQSIVHETLNTSDEGGGFRVFDYTISTAIKDSFPILNVGNHV